MTAAISTKAKGRWWRQGWQILDMVKRGQIPQLRYLSPKQQKCLTSAQTASSAPPPSSGTPKKGAALTTSHTKTQDPS